MILQLFIMSLMSVSTTHNQPVVVAFQWNTAAASWDCDNLKTFYSFLSLFQMFPYTMRQSANSRSLFVETHMKNKKQNCHMMMMSVILQRVHNKPGAMTKQNREKLLMRPCVVLMTQNSAVVLSWHCRRLLLHSVDCDGSGQQDGYACKPGRSTRKQHQTMSQLVESLHTTFTKVLHKQKS